MMDTFEGKGVIRGAVPYNESAVTEPVYLSAAFQFESCADISDVFSGRNFGHIYSRISNPTVTEYEQAFLKVEKGIGAVLVSSGLAAITGVVLALCESGDEIVASYSLFGGTYDLFDETVSKMGVQVRYVDGANTDDVANAITERTQLVFVETLGNPKLDIPDFDSLSALCRSHNIPLVVDSTATSPALFEAKASGADIVIHSATKYLSGDGTVLAGIVVDTGNYKWKHARSADLKNAAETFSQFAFIARFRRHILHNVGACVSPIHAAHLMAALSTLKERVLRHSSNALKVARYLQSHSRVRSVSYAGLSEHAYHDRAARYFSDGFGGLLTFELASQDDCFACADAFRQIKIAANLGDAQSLVIHPKSTIFYGRPDDDCLRAGVTDCTLRFSVGTEECDLIISDLEQALGG